MQLFKIFTYVTCIYFYVGIGENRKKSVFTEAEVQRDHLVRFRFWGLKFSNFYFVLPVLPNTFHVPLVAPMRGRGIARGMMGGGGRMDSFRTRTPNTSRPPSMHVDDFMKLEKGQNEINSNAVLPIRRVDSLIQRVKHIYLLLHRM